MNFLHANLYSHYYQAADTVTHSATNEPDTIASRETTPNSAANTHTVTDPTSLQSCDSAATESSHHPQQSTSAAQPSNPRVVKSLEDMFSWASDAVDKLPLTTVMRIASRLETVSFSTAFSGIDSPGTGLSMISAAISARLSCPLNMITRPLCIYRVYMGTAVTTHSCAFKQL